MDSGLVMYPDQIAPQNFVAIPTIGQSHLLGPLVDDLLADGGVDELIIMDNTPDSRLQWTKHERLTLVRCPQSKWGIHQMWNWAWRWAKRDWPTNLCLLNDDIKIPYNMVTRLASSLRGGDDDVWCVYPNYTLPLELDGEPYGPDTTVPEREGHPFYGQVEQTHGTYKDGGMWGCAFMLRAELLHNPLPPIDEQFVWWCGDDDLVAQIELHGGKVCRVNDIALEHPEPGMSQKTRPELHEIGWADLKRFRTKYRV